jgi:FkbM family methyltransferase
MNYLTDRFVRFVKPVVEQFPVVAMAYRNIRDSKAISGEMKNTPMGFKFLGNPSMEQGSFEPEETEMAKRLLRDADVFINIGANIGYYCCYALQRGKHTVAFEPIEKNVRGLYKNVEANRWGHMIEIFPLALSNDVAIVEMFGGGTGASLVKGWAGTSLQNSTLVPANTADNVLGLRFQGKKCFVLVDIEGAEKKMLEGANFLLSACQPKPVWMVEICAAEHQPKGTKINPDLLNTFELFWNNGYESWSANEQCRYISPEEVRSVAANGKDTFLTHNFIFIEKGKKSEVFDG